MVAVTGGSAESERNDREERREQEGGVGTPPALVKSINRYGSSNRKAHDADIGLTNAGGSEGGRTAKRWHAEKCRRYFSLRKQRKDQRQDAISSTQRQDAISSTQRQDATSSVEASSQLAPGEFQELMRGAMSAGWTAAASAWVSHCAVRGLMWYVQSMNAQVQSGATAPRGRQHAVPVAGHSDAATVPSQAQAAVAVSTEGAAVSAMEGRQHAVQKAGAKAAVAGPTEEGRASPRGAEGAQPLPVSAFSVSVAEVSAAHAGDRVAAGMGRLRDDDGAEVAATRVVGPPATSRMLEIEENAVHARERHDKTTAEGQDIRRLRHLAADAPRQQQWARREQSRCRQEERRASRWLKPRPGDEWDDSDGDSGSLVIGGGVAVERSPVEITRAQLPATGAPAADTGGMAAGEARGAREPLVQSKSQKKKAQRHRSRAAKKLAVVPTGIVQAQQ